MNDSVSKYAKEHILLLSILFICLLVAGAYCFCNEWMNIFFDFLIKAISGIGTIVAAIFVYYKWQDEKNRKLYEESLTKVYAPLVSILCQQEIYRKIHFPQYSFGELPIISIKETHTKIKMRFVTGEPLHYEKKEESHKGVLYREQFLEKFEEEDLLGLASPKLLKYISDYKMILQIEEDARKKVESKNPYWQNNEEEYEIAMNTEEGRELDKITTSRCDIERNLVKEIVSQYKRLTLKMGLYDDNNILDDLPIQD